MFSKRGVRGLVVDTAALVTRFAVGVFVGRRLPLTAVLAASVLVAVLGQVNCGEGSSQNSHVHGLSDVRKPNSAY